MMKTFVWDRTLRNNYPSKTAQGELETGASVVVMAPSIKKAIEVVQKLVDPSDKFGPSVHYQRMAESMEKTEPTSATPVTTPGRVSEAKVLFLSIAPHYNDTQPLPVV